MTEKDKILESQIGDFGGISSPDKKSDIETKKDTETKNSLGHAKYFGQENKNRQHYSADELSTTSSGLNIRNGWIPIDRTEFEERGQFYPSDWEFFIRPATVDDIKNWSSIDEERIDQVNEVLNEIIKSCVKIQSSTGNVSWGRINSWDRFWFLLKVREYTFDKGESKIQYDDICINCNQSILFELTSNNLVFELPEQDIIDKYFDPITRVWSVNPKEFDINGPTIKFYVPTLEKDAAIFDWALKLAQNNKKPSDTLLRFLPWMVQKVSRDEKVNEHFIREAEGIYKMWGIEMFSFADEILRNVEVIPDEKLRSICPHCGEEVTSEVRFPNGIRSLFSIQGGHKKFGKK